jgi:hypothetical protein
MKKSQRIGWLKPYQWVMTPFTCYERRAELRVRESRQTAIVWDKRYYNIDTMKFDSNNIKSLNSFSLCDLMEYRDDGINHYHGYHYDMPLFRRKDDFD